MSRRANLNPTAAPNAGAARLCELLLRTRCSRLAELAGVDDRNLRRYLHGQRLPTADVRALLESNLGIAAELWMQSAPTVVPSQARKRGKSA